MSDYADLIERLVEGKSSYIDPLARDLWNRDGFEARDAISRLEREKAALADALRPFVDLGPQRGAWGVISKKLDGLAPMTVTVTKSQMLTALDALSRTQEQTA